MESLSAPGDDRSIADDEQLYRGILPDDLAGGRISSTAFKVRPGDHVSVDRGSLCSPCDTLRRLPKSVGVGQIIAGAARSTPCVAGVAPDPQEDNPAHALILRDRSVGNSQWAKAARQLALACSWAISPPP
jgi:hypothetical protein